MSNSAIAKNRDKTINSVKKLSVVGMFTALAYITTVVIHIQVGFLTFDFKDAVMAIGAMICGPVYTIVMSVITSLVEMLTVSSTGVYGFIMNVVASIAFTLPAALIYHFRRKISGAIIGTVVSIFTMTGVMMIANLIVTPLYVNMEVAEVAKMIPATLLPFNLTKAALNAGTVLLLYKPLSTALKKVRLIRSDSETSGKINVKTTIIITAIAVALIAASVAVFVLVLGGTISFGR